MSDRPFVPAAGSDWLLPFYDLFTGLLGVERFHRMLLDQAGILPGARVLEIGCGTGNLTLLAKRLHPEAEVVGIDPDPKALGRARRKAQRLGLALQFDPGYSERLAFPDASFDRVLSAFMLHHVHAEARLPTLREARRALKPGGSLHLADFVQEPHAHGGFLASLVHGRRPSRIHHAALHLMAEAGFAEAQEVAHQPTILGLVAYYRASTQVTRPSDH